MEVITRTTANKIDESLYIDDFAKLQKTIRKYMDKSISFYNGDPDMADTQ